MRSKRQPNHLWLPSLIVVLVILVGITFSLARLMAAPTVTLSLVPSTLTMAPGEIVTVTIEVQAGTEPIDGVAAYLDFDPTRFQVSEVSPNNTALPFELVNRFENTLGTLDQVRGALNQPFPSGTFTLATFQLRALDVLGTSALSFNQGVPSRLRQSDVTSGGVSVLGSVGALTVEITDASSPTPTESPTEPTPSTPTETPTERPTSAPTESPLPTSTPTNTPTESPLPSSTPTASAMPTTTPTASTLPTSAPTNSPTGTPSNTPTATVPQTQTVILSLVPSTLTMAPGEVVTVTIEVQAGAEAIDGVAAFLDFDPTRFQVNAVSAGAALPFELVNRFDNTLGTLDQVRGALNQPFPSGTFTLATFQLRALDVLGTSTLSFNQGVPSRLRQSDVTSGGVSVLGAVGALTVEITDASSPTPTSTPTSVPTESPTSTPISTSTPTTIAPSPTPSVPPSWRVFIPSIHKNSTAIFTSDFTPSIGARALTIKTSQVCSSALGRHHQDL
ncbi:hypothetical protein [Candidatus Chloroploca asiatica]|uniref:Cohesin domain-containing protein n=1 Tax=Candidatus Chloroploca asiatica TaxID=1506545 RepID=A0A2H3KJ35_9CHLR|nr:hypothetical protein [Candidatus Chloroploca asiatica]PDV97909.1 hypothetical protein A9Q02_16930 [Candidatus Chloroploca asiatica]